jgi:hypothetical protein
MRDPERVEQEERSDVRDPERVEQEERSDVRGLSVQNQGTE